MSPRRPRVPLVPGAVPEHPTPAPDAAADHAPGGPSEGTGSEGTESGGTTSDVGARSGPAARSDRRGAVIDLHAVQQRRGTDGADRTGIPTPAASAAAQGAPEEAPAGERPAGLAPRASSPAGRPARARRAAVTPRRPAGRGSSPAGETESRRHAALPEPVPARQITGRSLLVVLTLLAAAVLLTPTLRTLLNQQLEISAAREDIAAQESRRAEYEAQIRRWDAPQYVAQQARERLDLVMPSETLYTVTGLPEEGAPASDEGDRAGEPQDVAPTDVNERLPWVEGLWDSVVRAGTT